MTEVQPTANCVNSIFQRPWWLDAVAPGQWKELIVEDKGAVCARMPIIVRQRYGCRFIDSPVLTQTLGPWLRPSDAKPPQRLANEKAWMTSLIEQLPQFDYFCQNFHYSVQNWYPFYWKNFESSVIYTYVISDLSDFDKVCSNFESSARNKIRKAQKQVGVRTDLGLDALWKIAEKSFARWNKKPPYTFEYLSRLDEACQRNNARRLFCAEDASGNIHAAVYLVYDEHSAYYLIGGADPEYRNSGAANLLMSEAIQFASTVTKAFDFEGTMVEQIEEFFRSFGGVPKPLIRIRGYSQRMKIIQGMKSMFSSGVRRAA